MKIKSQNPAIKKIGTKCKANSCFDLLREKYNFSKSFSEAKDRGEELGRGKLQDNQKLDFA